MLTAVAVALSLAAAAASSCGSTRAKVKEKTYPVAAVVLEAPAHFDILPEGSDCWVPAAPGAAVLYGDTVRNGAGGGLVLVLASGGTLRAGEMSEFDITKGSRNTAKVQVGRGEVWLALPGGKATEVTTSSVKVTVAAAGGKSAARSFGVKVVPGGPTTVTTEQGSVELEGAGASVTLEAGNQSVCEQGKAPSKPAKAEATSPSGGLAFLVGLQSDTYFRNGATRDKAGEDARAKISVDPADAWPYVNLGRALLDSGNTTDARTNFLKALEFKKGFSQALAGLGKAALIEQRWSEASSYYDQAKLADNTSLEAALGLANSALGAGDMREAEKRYRDTLDLDPQSYLALTGLGMVKLLEGAQSEALEDLQNALDIEPAHAAALEAMSYLYSLRGNLDRSITHLKKAVEAEQDDYRVRSTIADRYLRTGMSDAATTAFRRLAESEEKGLMAAGFQGLGAVAQGAGDIKGAIADWSKAQDLVPDRTPVLEDLGQADLLTGEPAAAIASLSRAASADINDWRAHELLARAYLATGQAAQAVPESRLAVSLAPSEWSAHLVLGLALQAVGSTTEAATELDRGLDLKPESRLSASDHVMLAEAYTQEGKNSQALAQYRAAESLYPSEAAFHRLAGDLLAQMGRKTDALAEYRRAVELDSSDLMARLKLASAMYAAGQKKEAIQTLQKAVEKNPNDPATRLQLAQYLLDDNDIEGALFQLDAAATAPGIKPDLLASVLVARGNARDRRQDFAGAIADYARAVSSDQSRGDAWFFMAGDLERTGKPADARTAYTNAAALCKDRPEWKKFYDESAAKLSQMK
jgi:tetratricopeptide (TPR) repeat protein